MTDRQVASSPPEHQPRLRYEFLEHLGSGGMADVYRARDTELGRYVAIKVFRDDSGTVADLTRREREIHLLGGMSHPGLVGVHDAGMLLHDGHERRYVVMELVEGLSLAHRLARGPLTPRQAADIGAQMADALSYVHGRSVVHRDVKPENILLAETPALGYTLVGKLADFGVAQFVDGARMTGDGAIMGTAAYISPEQARGEEVGPPSDVYSLGLVLLEGLRGEREYSGSAIEAALARLHRPPAIPDDLPEEWRRLLAAMTHDDPAQRPTAHEVAATLRDVIRSMILDGRGKRGRARRSMLRRSGSGGGGMGVRAAAAVSSVVGATVVAAVAVVTLLAGGGV
ncbi:serine/threonine-protein kinase [Agromyces sp. NPDC049794]|uniref:serine/threonine-protein kinase n=1 Tax=unclassified Agromyces TaxID=2639701 RepID=UPI0033D08F5C